MSKHLVALLALSICLGGCAQRMVGSLVSVPFKVARHVAVETAKVPIDAAEIGARGVVSAVVH
ncbi:MAG: hypothetical protein GC162_13005 [Planctomycetes bacterium]|nr:hypothetical protein [Planctomycetota bacterium]